MGLGLCAVAVNSTAASGDAGADLLQFSYEQHASVIAHSRLGTSIDEARQLMRQRRFVDASVKWQNIYRENSDDAGVKPDNEIAALLLLNNGYAQFNAGNIQTAANSFNLALKHLSSVSEHNRLLFAAANYLIAEAELRQYQLESALQHYLQAQRWLNSDSLNIKNAQRDTLFSRICLAKGEALFQLEKYDQSRLEFDKALRWASQADNADSLLAARTAQVALMLRTSSEPDGNKLKKQILPFAGKKTAQQQFRPDTILLFADVVSQIPLADWPSIESVILQVNQNLDRIVAATDYPDLLKSNALGVKARFYAKSGRDQDADTLLQRAIRIDQQFGDKLQLSRWLSEYGALKKKQGDFAAAVKAYRMAVAHLDVIKNDVMLSSKYSLYHSDEYYNDIYLGLADLLLQQSAQQSAAPNQQSLLREVRQVLETKKNVDLQNYFHDQCIANFKKNVRTLDDIAQSDTAIFYPIVLPDRLELLLSHNGNLKRYVSAVPREQLRQVVTDFRHQLMDVNTQSYLSNSKLLYDWLIRPMQATLDSQQIKNLVVVSESLLRTIPFSVFNDGDRFLVQKYALALSPALSLTDSNKINRRQMQVLLGGLSESVQGFPALNYVKGELEEIQDLYANELLLNRDFVTSRFSEALSNPQFSVAHVASHSEMSFDSRRSYILTFDGKISFDQLGSMTSVEKRRQPIDLLTLSACQTAAGDDRAALGLAGVAVKSGARSALATLWAIDDLASSLLVSEFYKQLSDNDISKAQALRNAQKSLIASRRFGHPAYWSSFLLIGNWL